MEKSKAGDTMTIPADQTYPFESRYEPTQKGNLDPGLPVLLVWSSNSFFLGDGTCPFSAKAQQNTRGVRAAGIPSSFPEQPLEGSNKIFMACELSYWDFWVFLNPTVC